MLPTTNTGNQMTFEDQEDNKLIAGMKNKLHEDRMTKIRECLAEERKKSWIYVGNTFREPAMAPSKQ